VEHKSYVYDGKLWNVPKEFEFPQWPQCKVGWDLWLRGQPDFVTIDKDMGMVTKSPVRPFRLLQPNWLSPYHGKKIEE